MAMSQQVEKNVPCAFFRKVDELREEACIHHKQGGRWRRMSWLELKRDSLSLAVALRKMGIRKGDRVAMMVTTRPEWTVADLAIMSAGAINVPIYCTFTPDRIRTILRDSRPKAAIVEDAGVAERLLQAHSDDASAADLRMIGVEAGSAPDVLAELIGQAPPEEIKDMERFAKALEPHDAASYVYTSGTTGALKAVVVTHGMILAEMRAAETVFGLSHEDVALVCLPLAHVLGRLSQLYPLLRGTQSAYAESFERLAENYREVRPHYVCGVPRMLEKIYERVEGYLKGASPRMRRLAAWSLKVGQEHVAIVQKKRPVPLGLALRHALADLVVFRRLRSRLGGRLKLFVCGGARLPEEICRFFHVAGIAVLEGYGLTETFAAVTVNRVDDYHFGTVGKPLPDISVRIAQDGEILVKGPNVFAEYLNRPEETRSAFDAEGWFRTGDLGEYSRDGFLRITGRKKDMIVTAGGKNIAPQRIEALMANSPYINHFIVQGDGRKFLTALITLNEPRAREYLKGRGIEAASGSEMASHPAIRELVGRHVEDCNKKLSSFETIKRFAILDGDFTVSGGELTPTLKVRRDFTAAKYRDVLDGLYRD